MTTSDPNRYERALPADAREHDDTANVLLKRTGEYGWDADAMEWVKLAVDTDGKLQVGGVDMSGVSVSTDPWKIAAGPVEATGYNYIGYKDADGAWYIKRQNLSTYLWGYEYGVADFATSWADKENLNYGDPE